MDALDARGLTKVYEGRGRRVEALDQVDFKLRPRTLFAFLGRNGAGKTTFIKIAATLLLPTSGTVQLFGHDVVHEVRAVRPLIAIVPQEGRPFYHLTPREHIYEYLRVRGASHESARDRTEEVLHGMGLMPYATEMASLLSGGLQQRTLVAMILATEAPFLFLDEPTLGMDPFARRQVWDIIRRATRHGSTVLLTTHYLDEAEQLSEDLAVIENGHILYRGTAEDLRSRIGREVRLQFGPGIHAEDLKRYGKVFVDRERLTLLGAKSVVPELTELAMRKGSTVSVGPVTLEEAFLELVGRGIEEDS